MGTLAQFNVDLTKFAQKVQTKPALVVKRIAFDVFRRVVLKTPVDTGRARASWTIQAGTPDHTTVAPDYRAQGETIGAQAAQAQSIARLRTIGHIPLGQPIWISNNLPYAVPLEQGHSQQAPAGMVVVTLQEIMLELDALIKGVP